MVTKLKLGLVLLLVLSLAAGAGALVYPVPTEKQPEAKKAAPPTTAEKKADVDRYGDPLPPGAAARLGSIRLRHNNLVESVVFAPDGKTMLSGDLGGFAYLWDVATGKRLRVIRQSSLSSLALDPKGKTVALASQKDGAVKLYELATGKEVAAFPGHRGGTESVIFSPDGKLLATGGTTKDNTLRLWNVAEVREIRSWPAEGIHTPFVRFTPDGKALAYVVEQLALRFRDIATGMEREPPGPLAKQRLFSFSFAPDGKTIITGSPDDGGLLQLWDAESGKEIRTIARKHGNTGYMHFAPDGKSVWAATLDVRRQCWSQDQWDLASGKRLQHLTDSSERMRCLALSPDGKRLAAGDGQGNVYLWDTKTGRKTLDFGGHRSSVSAVVFERDSRRIWTGGSDLTIRLWSVSSSEQLRQFSTERGNDRVYDLALRPDGKMLAMAVLRRSQNPPTEKCDIRLWDLTTNKELEPLRGHAGWVLAVAFTPDGRTIASRSYDRTIRLWDVATGKQRHLMRCGLEGGRGISFSADGSRLAASLDKETIGFWDVESGRLVRRLHAGSSVGHVPLLSQDGRNLLVGGGDRPLQLWEVASGKERFRFDKLSTKGYTIAALSPNNRIVAATVADHNQSIQLWNLMSGEPLGKFDVSAIPSYPVEMTFSPDSRALASALADGTTVIWNVPPLSPKPAAETKLSPEGMEERWSELAGADAAKAYRAVRTLTTTPRQSIPLLQRRLAEAAKAKVDAAKIARLLSDLDSGEFAVRDNASRQLEELGMSAEAAMRKTLQQQQSLEVRHRLEAILEKLESGARPGEQLRSLRAIEVLEHVGSQESRQALREIAQGQGESWLKQEAKASLARLEASAGDKP